MADEGEFGSGGVLGSRSQEALAIRPSTVKLPERPPQNEQTIFEFFLHRFPRIPRATWLERFTCGKVWATDELIDTATSYQPLLEVHYQREVEQEPPVREDFRVVYADRHLLVVDKPPNLPVTPGGCWARGCLLHLLLETTGNDQIAPLHRLDRLTSGIVLLSLDPKTRSHFARLFQPRLMVEKVYTAICEIRRDPPPQAFTLAHHIARSSQEYWRQVVQPELPANAYSEVEVMAIKNGLALLQVRPSTGRKHQIRVQLAHEDLPILGDPLYGSVPSYDPYDISQRMWLDAHRLVVPSFPQPSKYKKLTASWTSSRSPTEFFQRARKTSQHFAL